MVYRECCIDAWADFTLGMLNGPLSRWTNHKVVQCVLMRMEGENCFFDCSLRFCSRSTFRGCLQNLARLASYL